MDRIQPLRIFARVAELGSFTGAAASLGLPKASISSQVATLEAELGTRLFQRTTRRVRLTDDGRALYERARDLVADLDEIQSLFQSEPSALSGRVRVDMSSRMARFEIIPRLPELLAQFPQLQIELGATDRKVDLIREGYDCVIRGGTLSDSSLISRKIADARVINLASPGYLESHGTPTTVEDLERHYLVRYVSSFGEPIDDGFDYLEAGKCRSVKMKSRVTVDNAESYVAACEAGLGIIQSPAASLRESCRSGRLVEVLPTLKAPPLPIHILYPHRRQLPRRVRVFIEWVQAVLAND